MKPIKLQVEGLHSFEKPQVVDFSAIGTRGIFGIFGATGSGKSTILDAIVLALYGKVQRSKTNSDFINLKSSKAEVVFDFSFVENGKEKCYSVKRTFKRKNKNRSEIEQSAEVYEVGAMGRHQIIEGANKVDAFITNLFGMSETEFLTCIALPQGEFASFLKAKPNERVSIIGNIFDLNKYGQELWEKVKVRTDRLEKEKAVLNGKIAVVGPVDGDRLIETKNLLNALQTKVDENKKLLEQLTATEKSEREIVSLGTELEAINNELEKYNSLAESMSVNRTSLAKAKRISENKFLFNRNDELSKIIISEEDEIYKIKEILKSKRARSDEFYCESTLELEEISGKIEKSIARMERLKGLLQVEERVVVAENELKGTRHDLQICLNKKEDLNQKINTQKVEKALKVEKLKTLDENLEELKEQLRGFESVLNYMSLSQFSAELNVYKKYIEQKHAEAVQAMSLAIENKNKFAKQKKDEENKLKVIYKNFDIGERIGTPKLVEVVKNAYDESVKFATLKKAVETLLEQRVLVATETRAEDNRRTRLEADKVRLDLKCNEMSTEIEEIEGRIKELQRTKESALSQNGLADVIANIKIGDECPVCRAEVLTKATPDFIDVMVLADEISELEEVLKRKREAKENVVYALSKVVAGIEAVEESLLQLEKKQESLKQKTRGLFGLKDSATIIDEEAELKELGEAVSNKLVEAVKAEREERLIFERLTTLDGNITKQNCVSISSQMEVSHWAEILEKIALSIKDKDVKLLAMVGKEENITEKLNKLEDINAKLDGKMHERDAVSDEIAKYDAQIVRLESELAVLTNEQSNLELKISTLEINISTDKITINAECVGGSVSETIELEQAQYDGFKHREKELLSLQEDSKKDVANYTAELNALETKYLAHKEEHKGIAENVIKIVKELGLSNISDAKLFAMNYEEISELSEKINKYDNDFAIAKSKKKELEAKLNGRVSSSSMLEQIVEQIDNLSADTRNKIDEMVRLEFEINTTEEKLTILASLQKEAEKIDRQYELAKDLYDVLKGKALMEFIAEEFIDDISYMASNKLQTLMDGRYVLKYQNKEFTVIDNFNDACVRPVTTLSGGEMFVVSLALALSISDAIATKANKNIDFFFLDEGFGTLDKNYCEYIVDALIKLESQNLTIGLISHIPELQERISQKLEVVKTANGSVVRCVSDI